MYPSVSSRKSILVANDAWEVRDYFDTVLRTRGYSVRLACNGDEALRQISRADPISLVLLDAAMPMLEGLDTLREIRRTRQDLPVILVSGAVTWPQVKDTVDGPDTRILEIPVSPGELIRAVEEALRKAAAPTSPSAGFAPSTESNQATAARSNWTRLIERIVAQVGSSDVPVVLQGETGVGKEVFARKIHSHSSRAKKPFLKLNCAALPSELVESELFGFERGAFTGAFKERSGRFEMAQGGTILLDEIGDMDIRLQAKLLQVLQDKEFHRLGSSEMVSVDVRVMAATHCDLKAAIREGRFRQDLYYRLNVVGIQIPPLRERKDEILWLAEYFLKKYSPPEAPPPALTRAFRSALLAYHWPGNVRELENLMRKYIVFRDPILLTVEIQSLTGAAMVVPKSGNDPASADNGSILDRVNQAKRQMELDAIMSALETARWNRREAAALLNLDYKAFLYKMKKLGIEGKVRS